MLATEKCNTSLSPYTSDIDHTGELSEAIVTLPQEVPPKGTVELEIGYEGVIPLDATRLSRIGVPKKVAEHSDWDLIGNIYSGARHWICGVVSRGHGLRESVGRQQPLRDRSARWKASERDAR